MPQHLIRAVSAGTAGKSVNVCIASSAIVPEQHPQQSPPRINYYEQEQIANTIVSRITTRLVVFSVVIVLCCLAVVAVAGK